MKKIILAALMVMSASASAQTIEARQITEVVKLTFPSSPSENSAYVGATTVCLDGKLFAVAVQNRNYKDNSGVALTQIFETKRTGVNNDVASYHVDCKIKKEVVVGKK